MNILKRLERDRIRFRKRQNQSAISHRRLRKLRVIRAKYWLLRKKKRGPLKKPEKIETKEKEKKEKKKTKKKEPELEIIDESEIDELYALDDEEFEDETKTDSDAGSGNETES